jgi:ribonuclease HI
MKKSFTCSKCGQEFQVPQAALDKYPGWVPKVCMPCKNRPSPNTSKTKHKISATIELNLSTKEVLSRFTAGPNTGVFTDGSAQPNPGPGGWGAVFVEDDQIIKQRHGHEPHTTNNRMELTALIEAYKMIPADKSIDIYTDSQLCVKTLTEWAKNWEAMGWRRKSGPIKNLELVKELYALFKQRPQVNLRWIKAHDGSRWNEYADSLATAYTRDEI